MLPCRDTESPTYGPCCTPGSGRPAFRRVQHSAGISARLSGSASSAQVRDRLEAKGKMAEQNFIAETESSSAGQVSPSRAGLSRAGIFAGRFRWVICGLLFLGVSKNFMDRQVLAVLKGP